MEAAVAQVFGAGKCRVLVQVPLCRLVKVEEVLPFGERQRWQNKIDRKTVDFVVCDFETLRPMFSVELDGTSHDTAKARKRDALVEESLRIAGASLVRFDRRKRDVAENEVVQRLRASQNVPVNR